LVAFDASYMVTSVSRWQLWKACWLGVALTLFPGVALANQQFRLFYVREPGTEACPEEVELRLAVASRLGYDPFSPTADAAVVARVSPRGERLSGSVEITDGSGISRGRRDIEASGERCDELFRALALSVSIAIDPERALEAEEAPPPKSREPASSPSPSSSEPAPEEERGLVEAGPDRTEESTRVGGAFGATARSLIGVSNSPSYGGAVFGRLSVGSFALGVEALYTAAPYSSLEAVPGAELGMTLFAVAPHVCYQAGPLIGCALASFGDLRAESRGIAEPGKDRGFHASAGGRVGFEPGLSENLSLVAHVDLLTSLTRSRVTIDAKEAYRQPALILGAGLGLGVHFF
jgi:hypothetical protein